MMTNQRLLLIEDDYDVAEMLLLYFRSRDYDVDHADDGKTGIEMARTHFPNLILLDVMLPDMDGYDVCVQLRSTALTRYIPILFLTQRDERTAKVRGLELGADDYITKPFDIDELRLRVQGAISRATRENLHESRSGLPTGPMVRDEIQRAEASGKPYTGLVFNLNGLGVFNDVYGFLTSSDVVNYAGKVIRKVIAKHGTPHDFIGIDHDRFVVITHAKEASVIQQRVEAQFQDDIRAFYSFIDADRGGILLNEGQPDEQFVPLMTLDSEQYVPGARVE